jgi:hypothetical protein
MCVTLIASVIFMCH